MNTYILLVLVVSIVAEITASSIVTDENGQAYYLVPLHRERRQTTNVDISRQGVASISHQGQVYNNDNINVDGRAFASKPLHPDGPINVGGNLAATHRGGHALNLGARHKDGFGTDVSANGKYNLYSSNDGNARVDAVGQYSRHYGGYGTGDPNWYTGVQFQYDF